MSNATGTVVSLQAAAQVREGAEAFRVLCRTIGEIGDATWRRFGEDVDGVDYREIVEALRASLEASLHNKSAEHTIGYLRALADLICINLDGCGIDPREDEWDPIKVTRRAFTA